jgi:hypothetical protein
LRTSYWIGSAYMALCATVLTAHVFSSATSASVNNAPETYAGNTPGERWFNQIKSHCNSVEVATAIRSFPPPKDADGTAYMAGCYALAGKTKMAKGIIDGLAAKERDYAATVVFNIGHPVADAGDDESAGPIMRLVIDYQPYNFMALYHAGMSEYAIGENDRSTLHLKQFLTIYQTDDGWRQNALSVLNAIETGTKPKNFLNLEG